MAQKEFEEKPKKDDEQENKTRMKGEDKKPMEDEEAKKGSEVEHDSDNPNCKCDKCTAQKGTGSSENPEESATEGADSTHSTTSMPVINTKQDVFNPPSGVNTGRNATGTTPGQESYSGKSANLDLMKSPLYAELSKSIAGMQKALNVRIEAMEKSVADRLVNVQKALDKWNTQSLYKGFDENNNPEAVMQKGITEQIRDGKVRYSN